jgi:hypothetical protein
MRKADHQLQQPLYMTVWQKADKKYPYSPENTGMTLVPLKEYPNYVSSTPTSCQMKRPLTRPRSAAGPEGLSLGRLTGARSGCTVSGSFIWKP